jgi:outer membrane protein OmpA-like peptidoglycan-associated protein
MKKLILFISIALLACPARVDAQDWMNKLGKTAKEASKRAVENRVERKSNEATNKAMDKAEESVKGEKDKKPETEDKAGNKVNTAEEDTNPTVSSKSGASAKTDKDAAPVLTSYSKYDFVPGDQILYYEDFSQDAIGDFPATWTTNSSGEVKSLNLAPGKWYQNTTKSGMFTYLNKITLPSNFILEFDYIPYFSDEAREKNPGRSNWYASASVALYSDSPSREREFNPDAYPGEYGLRLFMTNYRWDMDGYSPKGTSEIKGNSDKNCVVSEEINHVIVWVQNRRVRVYHKGAKIMDIPTLLDANTRIDRIRFSNNHEDNRPFFSNIKFTTASPDTRSKLITEGKLVTYGIYFDVNKDIVKPESYGTLNDIANVLKENPDVKVKITGHTDSDGDDEANLGLSQRRAASVKAELSKTFGIDESRMTTNGAGEKQPVAPNDKPENKARNRRVEFIKL